MALSSPALGSTGWVPIAAPQKRHATVRSSDKVARVKIAMNEITSAPDADPVSILDARDGECRWVIEDPAQFVCGARVHRPGSSWCAYHSRLVFVPDAKRREEERRMLHVAGHKSTRMMQSVIPQGW